MRERVKLSQQSNHKREREGKTKGGWDSECYKNWYGMESKTYWSEMFNLKKAKYKKYLQYAKFCVKS